MNFDGSRCPICHGNKSRPIKSIGIGISLVTIFGIIGFLFMNGTIEFNPYDLEKSIQTMPQNIQETTESAKKVVIETTEKVVPEPVKNVVIETSDKIQEKSSEMLKKLEEDQIQRDKEQKIANEKYLQDIALQIHELINEERTKNGLTSLNWNPALSDIARKHSEDMATRAYFEHESPEGKTFSDRYAEGNFNCEIITSVTETGNGITTKYAMGGENINYLEGYSGVDNISTTAVKGWMNSPGHKENILTEYWKSEGIGVAESGDKIYVTQDFC